MLAAVLFLAVRPALAARAAAGRAPAGALGGASKGTNLTSVQGVTVHSQTNAGGQLPAAEQARRLQGLAEAERDLKGDAREEDGELRKIEGEIAGLTQRRDTLRRSRARRQREIAFLHAEIGRLQLQAGENGTAVQISEGTGAMLDSETADQAFDSSAESATAGAAAAEVYEEATSASSSTRGAAAARNAEHSADQARTRVIQVRDAEQAQQEAAAAAQAQRRTAEEQRRKAEQEATDRQLTAAEEARRRQQALAESADDSFRQFMKEEDGEDQMGDSDYEDSANALAGAIGWDRKEIESKADNAVKQLTEAIGGKKVVQAVQGMMAGVR